MLNVFLSGERARLKKTAVPSIFDFNKPPSTAAVSRAERYKDRSLLPKPVTVASPQVHDPGNEPVVMDTELILGAEVDVADGDEQLCELTEEEPASTGGCKQQDAAVQCSLLCPDALHRFSHKDFVNDSSALRFYTSFENYQHLLLFFAILGPAVNELRHFPSLPDVLDQLLLTMIKLRLGKDDAELAYIFQISRSTVSSIFVTWTNFLYFQLKELNLWPDGQVIEDHMPVNFARLFPTTKIILDATEIPIEKPSNTAAQSITFSTYKNRNTAKTMIGCTPRGVVTYISDAYGGSVSDRQIIERSSLIAKYPFCSGDSIMADRGIMVQDLFASKNVKVNTPHMLKGKHQLAPAELVEDRRIASKRIHVERVIGLCKTFKILKKEMKSKRLQLANRIIFICFMINNFRSSIVGKFA